MKVKSKKLLAGSKLTPLEKLKTLADSDNETIRKRVASNLAVDINILEELSNDNSPEVRREVALNPEVTANLLKKLSRDRSADVRYAIAENIRTPISILNRISRQDANPYIRKRALETLNNFRTQLEKERENHKIVCHFHDTHDVSRN